MYAMISDPEMETYPPRALLALRTPANEQSACGAGVPTSARAVSTRATTVFVPVVMELYMYGRIYYPGR